MKRYLCHHALHAGRVHGLSIVQQNNDATIQVSPYEREIHSTEYFGGVIVAVRMEELSDFLIDDLEQMLATVNKETLAKANAYLSSSGLYLESDDESGALIMI